MHDVPVKTSKSNPRRTISDQPTEPRGSSISLLCWDFRPRWPTKGQQKL